MPSVADLESAGRRAALAPVPSAPPVETLLDAAGRHRTRHRLLTGAATMALLLAFVVPIALLADRSDTVTVVAGPEGAAAAAQVEGGDDTPSGAEEGGAAGQTDPGDDGSGTGTETGTGDTDVEDSDSARLDLTLGDGFALAIRVIAGDGASAAAAEAAAMAQQTRTVDGREIWIETDGDTATVSALAEPEVFVAVTGPADDIDRLIEAIDSGEFGGFHSGRGFPFAPGDPDGRFEFPFPFDPETFEGFDGEFPFPFDPETFEGFDGEFPFPFDPETFDPETFDPETFEGFEGFEGFEEDVRAWLERMEAGEMPFFDFDLPADVEGHAFSFGEELPEWLDEFDGDLEGLPDIEALLDGFGAHFDSATDGTGCLRIEIDGDETFSLSIPEGCGAES